MHALRINFFEAGGGQELTLSWRPPGASTFSVVPNEALSTDAGVVRVTSPGSKQCEGDVDSPGDGLPLDGVNPAYDLVNLRPAGFEPKVTGLEWMGDDLLVLTWGDDDGDPSSVTAAGEVWRLSGVKDADDPADVTPTKIAEDLREPMGIKVVDGDIYISEKHQLSKLIDADSNGTYEAKDEIATWPFDGNFHEFAFGLLYKDGFFYLNLSVSIDLGGATTVPQGSDDRGTHLKINKDTGEIEYVAGGLRTPHGIGWGPEDEIFVTDNQGGWLPANKLIHLQPGKFYNHFTTGPEGEPGRFDDERPTPPALWLPHNEIANSPSQPMLIPSGPFAGQMWIADVTYGGIQRAFLEKVEGEYQGAYFRMTQGLESGLTHLLLEDDGSIIVGGLGAGGNWGQTGKLQFGLQKLVPNGAETFDIQKMELAEGGFDLTYTKPLSDATLAQLADKYEVQQWTYVPTAAYGGPKVDEESLTVTDASVSSDRKTVSLKIDGLKPNRVVYVRSPRPFDAQDGTAAAEHRGVVHAQHPARLRRARQRRPLRAGGRPAHRRRAVRHRARRLQRHGLRVGLRHRGRVGEARRRRGEGRRLPDGAALRQRPEPVQRPEDDQPDRQRHQPADHAAADRGVAELSVLRRRRRARAGENTIELKHAAGDDGHVNLDSLRLAPAGTQRYEAEAATLAGGANVQTEHPGFSGDGYVGGYQNAGREHDVQGERARRRPGGGDARVRERPEPVRRHQGSEPLRQQPVREEARAAGHRRVDHLRDAERHARPARREQRHLDPLRRGRRRQREPRLPRRRRRTSRRSARRGSTRTTSSTATRWTAAAGRRSSARTRRATRSPTASCRSRRRPATSSAARSAHATSCSSGPRPTGAGRRRRRCRSTAPTTTSRPGSSRTRAPAPGARSS